MKRAFFLILILLLIAVCCWSTAFAEFPQGAVDEESVIDPNVDPILLHEGNPEDWHAGVAGEESDAYTPRLFMGLPEDAKSYARVRLSTSHTAVFIRFHGNYCMYDGATPILIPDSDSGAQYLLTYESGKINISLDDEVLYTGTTLTFLEHSGATNYFEINNCNYGVANYQGSLTCYNEVDGDEGLYLVNRVYVEDYIPGVVAAEIGNSYNIEALAAQAVAARGYVYSKISSSNTWYDVTDTSTYQAYWGMLNPTIFDRSIRAVSETAGQVLTYGGVPIVTYYSASNGGYTETVTNAWDGSPAYVGEIQYDDPDIIFGRNYRDSQGNPDNRYLEEVTISKTGGGTKDAAYAAAVLKKNGINASSVSVSSLTLSVASYAHNDCTHLATLSVIATGTYNDSILFSDSAAFSVSELEDCYTYDFGFTNSSLRCFWLLDNVDDGTYTLRHGRYGHGVGLSQIGARQRGSDGQTVSQILAFYYPGTEISTGYIGDRETLSALPSITSDMRITRSDGYLYTAASSASAKLAFVAAGSPVEILEENGEYYYLTYSGITGYLPKSAFTLTCSTVVIQNLNYSCNVRSGPGTNYTDIGDADLGSTYPLLQANVVNGWHEVQFGAVEGYISSRYATVVPDAPTTGGSSDPLAGDADGNGVVTNADAMMIFSYVMDGDAITEAGRADLDANGTVTLSDAALLCRMLGGQ